MSLGIARLDAIGREYLLDQLEHHEREASFHALQARVYRLALLHDVCAMDALAMVVFTGNETETEAHAIAHVCLDKGHIPNKSKSAMTRLRHAWEVMRGGEL